MVSSEHNPRPTNLIQRCRQIVCCSLLISSRPERTTIVLDVVEQICPSKQVMDVRDLHYHLGTVPDRSKRLGYCPQSAHADGKIIHKDDYPSDMNVRIMALLGHVKKIK